MIKEILVGILFIVFLVSGCTDPEAAARKAKEEVEATARAEAARKEMEAMPQAFQTPDYFKKNLPEKKSEATPSSKTINR